MFNSERIFCQTNTITGLREWIFNSREGCSRSYSTKENAEKALAEFIRYNIKNSKDGGRSIPKLETELNKLSLAPFDEQK